MSEIGPRLNTPDEIWGKRSGNGIVYHTLMGVAGDVDPESLFLKGGWVVIYDK